MTRNKGKRLLGILLAAVLLFSAVPITAGAADVILEVTFNAAHQHRANTDNFNCGMWEAVTEALSGQGLTKGQVTEIYVKGDAAEMTGYNLSTLTILFSANAEALNWPALHTLDFSGMSALKKVNYGGASTAARNRAFTVVLPDGLEEIGEGAFFACQTMTLATLPNTVTTIGRSAFHLCPGLTLTALPDGVTEIGEYAFCGCTNLALTALPDGVTEIGGSAFYECTNLVLTALPDGVTEIGESAFYGCTGLALTALPDGVTTIGGGAFYGCTDLALTALPDGVTTIGDNAFGHCTGLTDFEMHSTVQTIGLSAFGGCSSLNLTLRIPVDTELVSDTVYDPGTGQVTVDGTTIKAVVVEDGARAEFTAASLGFESNTEVLDGSVKNSTGSSITLQYGVPVADGEIFSFTAATEITGLPTAAVAGRNTRLTGAVQPSHATARDVAYTVKSDGGTGAAITGNSLTASGTGTVIVTASAAGGLQNGTAAFERDISITVTTAPTPPPGPAAYTVQFETNGGSAVSAKTVQENERLEEPGPPTKDGYVFAGWYTDAALTLPYNFTAKVTRDMTLYARWRHPFTDVREGAWYDGDVQYVYEQGLMEGTAPDRFSPSATTSRGMLVTVLWRLEGSPEPRGEGPFADLSADWSKKAIVWAAEQGILLGYPDGMFREENPVTREGTAVLLFRYDSWKSGGSGDRADLSRYTDAGSISPWALEGMRWANAKGLVNGRSETLLVPKGDSTRAEMAAVLRRYLQG